MSQPTAEKRPRSCRAASELMWCFFVVNWLSSLVAVLFLVANLLTWPIGAVHRSYWITLGMPATLAALVSTMICCVCLMGWLRLIHADVRDATDGRHAISPQMAAWPMCVPLFNVFWLYHALTSLGQTIWAGCRTHHIAGAAGRTIRRMVTAVLACLLACFLIALTAILLYMQIFGEIGYFPAVRAFALLLLCAYLSFLAASILLMCTVHVLSRDVDALHKARTHVDPNAVVPVDGERTTTRHTRRTPETPEEFS